MINTAPGFGGFSATWGPRRAPGTLGRAPARGAPCKQGSTKRAAPCTHTATGQGTGNRPPGPADEEHPLHAGHDAIGKAGQTGDQRQRTEKDLGPKTGDRRLGTEEKKHTT